MPLTIIFPANSTTKFTKSLSQMLHVWNIYLHLGNVWGKMLVNFPYMGHMGIYFILLRDFLDIFEYRRHPQASSMNNHFLIVRHMAYPLRFYENVITASTSWRMHCSHLVKLIRFDIPSGKLT